MGVAHDDDDDDDDDDCLMFVYVSGKKYCYGSMEGEYCHCDYCKCKHGYGQDSKGHKGCKGHR